MLRLHSYFILHTFPKQRPGFIARFAVAGQRPASCHARMSRAFSAPDGFWGHEPRALPWAGMNDTLGVPIWRPWRLNWYFVVSTDVFRFIRIIREIRGSNSCFQVDLTAIPDARATRHISEHQTANPPEY